MGYFEWPRTNQTGMDQVCDKAIQSLFPGYEWWFAGKPDDPRKYFNVGGKDNQLGATDCEAILGSSEALADAVKARNEATKASLKSGEVTPAELSLPADAVSKQQLYLKDFNQAKHADARDPNKNKSSPWGVTVAASANQQQFTFADPATPATILESSKEGYGVSLALTVVGDAFVFGAGYAWERAFKGGKEQQVCSPIGATTSLSCRNAALSAPKAEKNQIAFVEVRYLFQGAAKIAISPRIEYSIEDSNFGIRIPIFLARDTKRVLDGGITTGWTEDDHFGAGIFIGKSFSFF